MPKAATPKRTKTQTTLLGALASASRSRKDAALLLDSLIVRAHRNGLTQTEVANAASVSQAHVSRTLARYDKQAKANGRPSRSKKAGGR